MDPTKTEEKTLKVMAQTLETALLRITSKLQKARLDLSYSTYAKSTALTKQIAAEMDQLQKTLGLELKDGIFEIADYATEAALEEMQRLNMDVPKGTPFYQEYNREYALQAHKQAVESIAALNAQMSRQVTDMVRQDMLAITRRASVEGLGRKTAYKLLKESILTKEPSFVFKDARGRNWATNDYLNMLTRTVMADTNRNAYANTLAEAGHDLVKVSSHGAKDACRNWEGRILSLTGATPGYQTVDEAKATGEIFHPRCRHRLLAYHTV